MGLLDETQLDKIFIRRMIFHVVGPTEEDFQLMDEIDASGFENFFLARVRETNVGNRFNFIGAESGVRPALQSISEDDNKFVQLSKELTEVFQNGHKGAPFSSKGAFIIAQLGGISRSTFALIKFDDQKVLRYQQQTTSGGRVRAKVTEVNNTFVEDRKAMQKSALVVLDAEGGELAVYDRTNKKNIADYFKTFLGVRRLWTPTDATERLIRSLAASVSVFRDTMPSDVKRNWRKNLHDVTRDREAIEPGEDLNVFGAQVFGPFWQHEEFRKNIERELHRNRISGEVIEIDKNCVKPPPVRRLRTKENIWVVYPKQLDDAPDAIVKVAEKPDGSAVITITTKGIVDDELSDESIGGGASSARRRRDN
ncbi:nucleoid-associated protein [Rhodopseudomonas palustris]